MTIVLHCRQCGLPFERRERAQAMCSPECVAARRAGYPRVAARQIACRACGDVFTRRPGFKHICSNDCRRAWRRAKNRMRYATDPAYHANATARSRRTFERMRTEGGARWESYLERRNAAARKSYHSHVVERRERRKKQHARVRELIMKGKALERLQQEGLI